MALSFQANRVNECNGDLAPSIRRQPAGAENTTFTTLFSLKKTSKYSGSSHSQMVSYRQSFLAILFFGSPKFFKTSSLEEPRCNACQFPNPSAGLNHLLSPCFSSLACMAGSTPARNVSSPTTE